MTNETVDRTARIIDAQLNLVEVLQERATSALVERNDITTAEKALKMASDAFLVLTTGLKGIEFDLKDLKEYFKVTSKLDVSAVVSATSTAIASLSEEVKAIAESAAAQAAAVDGLTKLVEATQASLTTLAESVDSLKVQTETNGVGTTEAISEIAALNTNFSSLSETVSILGGDIPTLNVSVNQIKDDVTGLQTAIAGLQQRLELVEDSITATPLPDAPTDAPVDPV